MAEVIDENAIKTPKKRLLSTLSSKKRRIIELLDKKKTVIVEGEPAVFAAEAEDKATIVLLAASKDERVRRKINNLREPEFVVSRTIGSFPRRRKDSIERVCLSYRPST